MCVVCDYFGAYRDVGDSLRMIGKARAEGYPIEEKHLADVERQLRLLKFASESDEFEYGDGDTSRDEELDMGVID